MLSFIPHFPFSHQALGIAPNLSIRQRAVSTLQRRHPQLSLQNPPNRAALSEQLRSGHQPTQMLALISLQRLPSDTALDILLSSNLLKSPNQQVRLTAVATLGKLGVVSQTSLLVSVLADKDEDYSVRAAAANALGQLLEGAAGNGVQQSVDAAVAELLHVVEEDEEFIVRYASLVSLGNIGDAVVMPTLLNIVQNTASPGLEAAAAVAAIGEVVGPESVDEGLMVIVKARVADREDLVRAAVARTLGRWRTVADVERILLLMKSNEEKYGKSAMVLAVLDDALGTG